MLFVATFAAFLTPFLSSAVNLALPSIGKDLHANAIGLGWVISSFILSSAIFLLPFGRLGDIVGRKKIFSLGILLFTISTFLIIFSGSITSLIVFRIFQGLSSAMIFGTSMAIITSVFQPGERRKSDRYQHNCNISRVIVWSCHRRITYPVPWMEKYFCISCSFWHYFTYPDKQENKNRMGRSSR